MTDKDRDFAMEIALAAEGDHIWREWPKGRLTQSRIFRLANTLRPIIEAAQAAVRPEVAEGDRELAYKVRSYREDSVTLHRLTMDEAIWQIAAYRESQKPEVPEDVRALAQKIIGDDYVNAIELGDRSERAAADIAAYYDSLHSVEVDNLRAENERLREVSRRLLSMLKDALSGELQKITTAKAIEKEISRLKAQAALAGKE